jgi:hypothetical protein
MNTSSRSSPLLWLYGMFAVTVGFAAASFLNGIGDEPYVRIACMLLLFVLTAKGYRWARYFLALLYGLGGIAALLAAVTGDASITARCLLAGFGTFGLLCSMFLLRSMHLRERSALLEGGH